MWQALIAPIAGLFTKALGIVDKYIPDKDLAAKLKAELEATMLRLAQEQLLTLLKGQIDIVLAEVKGESWLQRNWRPILMLTSITIIANNYIIAPYIGLFFPDKELILELPGGLWALLNLGVGGYIAGRTVEKLKGVTEHVLPIK